MNLCAVRHSSRVTAAEAQRATEASGHGSRLRVPAGRARGQLEVGEARTSMLAQMKPAGTWQKFPIARYDLPRGGYETCHVAAMRPATRDSGCAGLSEGCVGRLSDGGCVGLSEGCVSV